MDDPTENIRRQMTKEINSEKAEREALEQKYGQVWDTEELKRDFSVISFLAPFIGVTRNSDGVKGALTFQHWPRYYWGFTPEK